MSNPNQNITFNDGFTQTNFINSLAYIATQYEASVRRRSAEILPTDLLTIYPVLALLRSRMRLRASWRNIIQIIHSLRRLQLSSMRGCESPQQRALPKVRVLLEQEAT